MARWLRDYQITADFLVGRSAIRPRTISDVEPCGQGGIAGRTRRRAGARHRVGAGVPVPTVAGRELRSRRSRPARQRPRCAPSRPRRSHRRDRIPLRHRPRGILRKPAAAHEDARQPLACALPHRGEDLRIEPGGGMEEDPARGAGVEHAVDDHAMKVEAGMPAIAITMSSGGGPARRRFRSVASFQTKSAAAKPKQADDDQIYGGKEHAQHYSKMKYPRKRGSSRCSRCASAHTRAYQPA